MISSKKGINKQPRIFLLLYNTMTKRTFEETEIDDEGRRVYHSHFPLLTLVKREHVFKNIIIGGVSDTLFPRSSHTSPISKDSHLYRRQDIKALKDLTIDGKSVCLTLIDLPIINAIGINDGSLLFCGIVEDTSEILSLIVYKQLQMNKTGTSLSLNDNNNGGDECIYMSTQATGIFVNITNRRKDTHSFNGNKFVFIQQQGSTVCMSTRLTIHSWKQIQRNVQTNVTSKETLIYNINNILATRLEDEGFLKDVYSYLQKRSRNTSIHVFDPANISDTFIADD